MNPENIPNLPKEWEQRLEIPFDGLFGESAIVKVLQEFVSDPYSECRPSNIEELTELTEPTVRTALNELLRLGVITKTSTDPRRPVYKADHRSKRLTALTFLTYAILDDRDGTDIMDASAKHYCESMMQFNGTGFQDAATFDDLGIREEAVISSTDLETGARRR
jgi:hypothetical protein